MTRLFNDPSAFADEMIEGFVAASSRWVQAAPGGVVRSTQADEPTVALVIGGGSGHDPAFGGLVGPGLAHGAAMGNLFASPSSQQVYAIAKAADQGRGVLLPADPAATRIRYCWGDAPRCSLRDAALPASPFELEVK